jgi:hypothetical protein
VIVDSIFRLKPHNHVQSSLVRILQRRCPIDLISCWCRVSSRKILRPILRGDVPRRNDERQPATLADQLKCLGVLSDLR